MELAAHWYRCQNLPQKRVNTSLVYREREDPVKDRLANQRQSLSERRTARISETVIGGLLLFLDEYPLRSLFHPAGDIAHWPQLPLRM